jgi:hypothetical protein
MTAWRQAVFVRQRRIDVIQRVLSKVLDEESWSPATPRRLRIGSADASSRGWTMIAPGLANFFLDRGGTDAPRLCRLARELHCPMYDIEVRDTAMTLVEADERGRMRVSGSPMPLVASLAGDDDDDDWGDRGARERRSREHQDEGAREARERRSREHQDEGARGAREALEAASPVVGFGLLAMPDDVRERIAALQREPPRVLADYLGALAGFPGWTRHGDDAIAAGELIYEPPRILIRANGRPSARATTNNGIMASPPETREESARATPRVVPPAHDRRGRRPRSASRPRR